MNAKKMSGEPASAAVDTMCENSSRYTDTDYDQLAMYIQLEIQKELRQRRILKDGIELCFGELVARNVANDLAEENLPHQPHNSGGEQMPDGISHLLTS